MPVGVGRNFNHFRATNFYRVSVSPFASILIKIFVRGFYRDNAGLFLFLFVTFFVYFFFVEVLNQTHLPPGEVVFHNLAIALTLISSPQAMAAMCVLWFLYVLKSWGFIFLKLRLPENEFLFLSAPAVKPWQRWISWSLANVLIALPMICYGVFCAVIGIVFGHVSIALLLLGYTFILAAIGGVVLTSRTARPFDTASSLSRHFAFSFAKPFFSWHLFQILEKQKLSFVIIKCISWALMSAGFYGLANVQDELRAGSLITLAIAVTHIMLVFHAFHFEREKLTFLRNLPRTQSYFFFTRIVTYLILTLPEIVWYCIKFTLAISMALCALHIGLAMLFRSLLLFSPDVRAFIPRAFYLSCFLFLLVLMGLTTWLSVVIMALAVIISFSKERSVV